MSAALTMVDVIELATPRARAPRIADDVREYIVAEIDLAREIGGGNAELAFTCGWDPETRTIVSASVMVRGTFAEVRQVPSDLTTGHVVLHNHPSGGVLPSKPDFDAMSDMASLGVGYGIINNDASKLYMVREPLVPWRFRHPWRPPAVRYRTLRLWRFTLTYESPAPPWHDHHEWEQRKREMRELAQGLGAS